MISFDLFNNEERILVNRITANTNIEKIGRDNILKSLNMCSILSENEEVNVLIESVSSKIAVLTEEEWNRLKALLPWECVEGTTEEELMIIEANA